MKRFTNTRKFFIWLSTLKSFVRDFRLQTRCLSTQKKIESLNSGLSDLDFKLEARCPGENIKVRKVDKFMN